MQPFYRKIDRALFYWKTLTTKFFRHWIEVKRPKVKTFIYGIAYTANFLLTGSSQFPSPFDVDLVETSYGKFKMRPHTVDMIYISPSFERLDIDYLLRLIKRISRSGKKVLFLDIGANIGIYSIRVGNASKKSQNVHVMAFEAAKSTYDLLTKNIDINGLVEKITPFNSAIYSEDNKELNFSFNPLASGESGLNNQGTEKVNTMTLDTLSIDKVSSYDVIIFKMDVEGAEKEVFKGASRILDLDKEFYFLIEDFVKPEIVKQLEDMGASFLCKFTPYNSWWHFVKQ
jgi:FkbM family methyltransferase